MRILRSRGLCRLGALGLAALALALPRGVGNAVVGEVTVYVEATEDGNAIVGQQIRLIPAATQPSELELPDEDEEYGEDDDGYDDDPYQGVTGANGTLIFKGAPEIFGLPEGTTGTHRVRIPNGASVGHNVFFGGKVARVLAEIPLELRPFVSGVAVVDGLVAVSFQFPLASELVSSLGGLKGVQGRELNPCKDKSPAGSPDTWADAPRGSDLPGARLALAGGGHAR